MYFDRDHHTVPTAVIFLNVPGQSHRFYIALLLFRHSTLDDGPQHQRSTS
jgi:hypothetical protein